VASTQDVIFASGAATRIVILDPIDGTVDNQILVTIHALDAFGNVATGENRGVTLLTSGSAVGGFVSLFEGVGTDFIFDQVAETVQLSLSDTQGTGLDVSSTQNVVFAPGAVTRFWIDDPTDGPVGTAIPVTVRAQDQYGNQVTSENRDVTLVTSGSATGGGLVNIQGGQGIRNISNTVPETVNLSLSDTQGTGLNVSSTQDVVFGAGAAPRFVILAPLDGTVDGFIQVTVQAQDQFGNVVTTEFRDVTLLTSGAASGGGLLDVEFGVGSTFLSDQVAETVNLSLSDTQGTGLNVTSTQNVVFGVGAAAQFVILNPPDGTVGTAISVTVQALDQYGNLVTTENRDVTLLTTGSATGGGLVNIQNGTGTLSINDQVAETVILTLSDTEVTGLAVSSVQDVIFSVGAATRFVILDPLDGTVDTPTQVTIQAQDQLGNVVTTESRDVTLLTSGSAVGGGLLNVEFGVATTFLSDPVAETVNLSLSDTQGTGLNVSSTQNMVFAVGAPAQFFIVNPPDGTVGTPIPVTVQALDQHGNLVTTENRDVTLVTTGSATGGGLVNIQNGSGSLSINDQVAETITLSLSDTEVTGLNVSSIQDVNFAVGGATQFVILDPTDGTVDFWIPVTVQAQNQFGTVVTSENRDVTLLTSGSATGGGVVNIENGVGTLNVSNTVPETVNLSLSDTEVTGLTVTSTQNVAFDVGAAGQYVILDPPDGPVNTLIPVTVQAQDQHGNLVTTVAGSVTLMTSGSATGGGTVSIAGGSGTIDITDAVAETVVLGLANPVPDLFDGSTQDVVFTPVELLGFLNPAVLAEFVR
jgi:urease beta subunit